MYRWMNREVIKVKYIVINDCFGTIAVCILFFFRILDSCAREGDGVVCCAELGRAVEAVETVETVERMGVGEEVGKGVRVGRG